MRCIAVEALILVHLWMQRSTLIFHDFHPQGIWQGSQARTQSADKARLRWCRRCGEEIGSVGREQKKCGGVESPPPHTKKGKMWRNKMSGERVEEAAV